MRRRDFLKLLIASALVPACGQRPHKNRVGIALGGGGAKGLAHIPMLEVLDELGITPYRIAGTSIGAIIGCLYASGMSGSAIRKLVGNLTVSDKKSWLESLFSKDFWRGIELIEPRLGQGGLIDSDAFIAFLHEKIHVSRFNQLKIPLSIVATDFWEREQVVFDSGDLMIAVKASMAVPGLFNPVKYKNRVLVDGGLVNPVPYDLLLKDCDLVIAIDVLGHRTPDTNNGPSYFETMFNAFQIMQAATMHEKLQNHQPDIYIKPDLHDIRVLDFYKAEEIYRQAESSRKNLYRSLSGLYHGT
jgi:NTE family protein